MQAKKRAQHRRTQPLWEEIIENEPKTGIATFKEHANHCEQLLYSTKLLYAKPGSGATPQQRRIQNSACMVAMPVGNARRRCAAGKNEALPEMAN